MAEIEDISRVVAASRALIEEFRKQGLHVGWGVRPVCVVCNVAWPCADARPELLDPPCLADAPNPVQ